MTDPQQLARDAEVRAAQRLEQSGDLPQAVNAWRKIVARYAHLAEEAPAPGPIDVANPLVGLGETYKPSKRDHNYLPRYDHVFGPVRKDVRHVVEIGVQSDKSVRMWRDYFSNAQITGIDIDPACKAFEGERIDIRIGSQLDPGFLIDFVKNAKSPPDIVIDDGLHTEQAIFRSFCILYPALSPHGIYAIEDIIRLKNVYRFLQDSILAINHWPENVPGQMWQVIDRFPDDAGWFAQNTIGLEVYRFVGFIKRGFNPRENPHIRNRKEVFKAWNGALAKVRQAARELEAEGKKPSYDALVEKVGFQQRHYVRWHLDGVEEVVSEDSFKQRASDMQERTVSMVKDVANKSGLFRQIKDMLLRASS